LPVLPVFEELLEPDPLDEADDPEEPEEPDPDPNIAPEISVFDFAAGVGTNGLSEILADR
jgi:hypothetical protein